MNIEIIIPARLESRRFPRKLLYRINGHAVLWWTWHAARQTGHRVTIATDSAQIQAEACRWGARVALTGPAENGTERCAQVLGLAPFAATDIVVNWQGDAPLIPVPWVHELVGHMGIDPLCDVATVATRGPASRGAVEIEIDDHFNAADFRRLDDEGERECLLHHGLYAYKAAALATYGRWASTPAEREHGLEQLRWRSRVPVAVLELPAPARAIPEVNYPLDLELVQAGLEVRDAAA